MSEVPPATAAPTDGAAAEPRSAFPGVRLLYAIGFAIVAWFVFWLVLILALVQFIVLLVEGRGNQELKNFNFSLIQYLWELLAFVAFVRDEQPFPFGPFPKRA